MRPRLTYLLLRAIKGIARCFFRFDVSWTGRVPPDPWEGIRVLALLNHTSLYEPLFAGAAPDRFLRRIAFDGVAPIADKTARRPLVGFLFGRIARQVIPISRERDGTWEAVLERIDPDALVAILPEGRMKRPSGLDLHGRPMTIRGGIADVLEAIDDGRMLLVYSGGLHHVQAPGERLPRPFRTLRARLEVVDIREYRRTLLTEGGPNGFKAAVIRDLTRRRDLHCPTLAAGLGAPAPRS